MTGTRRPGLGPRPTRRPDPGHHSIPAGDHQLVAGGCIILAGPSGRAL